MDKPGHTTAIHEEAGTVTLADDLEQARAALTMIHGEPFNAEAPPEALQGDITPTELHYVRSNFPVPVHDGTLEVGGAVEQPRTLTLDDLRAMPAVERVVTLECAGNGADHGSYLLHPVLRNIDASDLTFERSLTLAHAADPKAEILIAYEMNGEPLNPDHGAPFRLIVPHWYGVASVKWLKHIDVLTQPFVGEFETGHYMYEWPDRPHEPVTVMRVRARITDPTPGTTIPAGTYTVRGKAWSGTGPVTEVHVSFTGEGDWHPANVEPPKGPYQWQDWSLEWQATSGGRHTLRARATDAAGNVQPEVSPWNRLGYGNNAIEVRYVDVR
jgi:DMSO/TMAO reductase YedYZ molybdopterin-dependent catalytic subunit